MRVCRLRAPRIKEKIYQVVSVLISAALIFTSSDFAQAAAIPSASPPLINLASFSLPSNLGVISDVYRSPKDQRWVVILQDLHIFPPVQRKIRDILNFLLKETPLKDARLIGLEGDEGKIPTMAEASRPDPALKRKVADYLIEQGELTGAEAFAIEQGRGDLLWGVENDKFYQADRNLYVMTLKARTDLRRRLEFLDARLSEVAKGFKQPPAVLEVGRLEQALNDGGIEPVDVLKEWLKQGADLPLAMGPYPHLRPLAHAIQTQGNALSREDIRQFNSLFNVTEELDAFAPEFKAFLTSDRSSQNAFLAQKSIRFLIRYLTQQATDYEVMDWTRRLQEMIARVKALGILSDQEVGELVHRISNQIDFYSLALVRNEPIVKLRPHKGGGISGLGRRFRPIPRYAEERAAPPHPQGVRHPPEEWEVKNLLVEMTRRAKPPAPKLQAPTKIPSPRTPKADDGRGWSRTRKRTAGVRVAVSPVPATETTAGSSHGAPQVAVLVAGGFHTRGLTDVLRKEGVSYLVIAPTVEEDLKPEYSALYEERLADRHLSKDEIKQGISKALGVSLPRAISVFLGSLIRANRVKAGFEDAEQLAKTTDGNGTVPLMARSEGRNMRHSARVNVPVVLTGTVLASGGIYALATGVHGTISGGLIVAAGLALIVMPVANKIKEEIRRLTRNAKEPPMARSEGASSPASPPMDDATFWGVKNISPERLERLRPLHAEYQKLLKEKQTLFGQIANVVAVADKAFREKGEYSREAFLWSEKGRVSVDIDSVKKLSFIGEQIAETSQILNNHPLLKPIWDATGPSFWQKAYELDAALKETYDKIRAEEGYSLDAWRRPNPSDANYLDRARVDLFEVPIPDNHFFRRVNRIEVGDYWGPGEEAVLNLLEGLGIDVSSVKASQDKSERKLRLLELAEPLLRHSDGMPAEIRGNFRLIIATYIYEMGWKMTPFYGKDGAAKVSASEFTTTVYRRAGKKQVGLLDAFLESGDPGLAEQGMNILLNAATRGGAIPGFLFSGTEEEREAPTIDGLKDNIYGIWNSLAYEIKSYRGRRDSFDQTDRAYLATANDLESYVEDQIGQLTDDLDRYQRSWLRRAFNSTAPSALKVAISKLEGVQREIQKLGGAGSEGFPETPGEFVNSIQHLYSPQGSVFPDEQAYYANQGKVVKDLNAANLSLSERAVWDRLIENFHNVFQRSEIARTGSTFKSSFRLFDAPENSTITMLRFGDRTVFYVNRKFLQNLAQLRKEGRQIALPKELEHLQSVDLIDSIIYGVAFHEMGHHWGAKTKASRADGFEMRFISDEDERQLQAFRGGKTYGAVNTAAYRFYLEYANISSVNLDEGIQGLPRQIRRTIDKVLKGLSNSLPDMTVNSQSPSLLTRLLNLIRRLILRQSKASPAMARSEGKTTGRQAERSISLFSRFVAAVKALGRAVADFFRSGWQAFQNYLSNKRAIREGRKTVSTNLSNPPEVDGIPLPAAASHELGQVADAETARQTRTQRAGLLAEAAAA